MIYTTAEAATLAAQAKLAREGRPRGEVFAVFAEEDGYSVGTWPDMRVDELPEGALIVLLP